MSYSINFDRLVKRLLSRIERLSSNVVMLSSCIHCRSSKVKCIFDVDLTNCLAYVRLRRFCDVVISESECEFQLELFVLNERHFHSAFALNLLYFCSLSEHLQFISRSQILRHASNYSCILAHIVE
jgi:hypothetical protein